MIFQKASSISKPIKVFVQVFIDFLIVIVSYYCSLLLRFGGSVPPELVRTFLLTIIPIAAIYILLFYFFTLYRSLWETASIEEMIRIPFATLFATITAFFLASVINRLLPLSIYIAAGVLVMILAEYSRLSYRILRRINRRFSSEESQRAMIFGAGEMGMLVLRQLLESTSIGILPVVFVDDDKSKINSWIRGIKIAGDRYDIPRLAKELKIDVIIFCVSDASDEERRAVLQICMETNCSVKTVPSLKEIMSSGKGRILRDIEMTDLLPRPEVKIDAKGIREYLTGTCVLVTGGGGSIGSELCRQLAVFEPSQLVVFDIYENNAYELLIELHRNFPDLPITVEIGSVRDIKRLEAVFDKYRPKVVFHAAAHKHVPLMEVSPTEAVKNNVFGTYNVAQTADKFGVQRFVLISTDKAVNPSSVMGATKRLAEHVIQYMNAISNTKFVAVRFGNVLGSNGSVIPLFQRQIAQGGPVTVTHKDITRYFMTIPEAARLVLQAGCLAENGEIFILDMGEPVRIDDVARALIRMSGYRPDDDIKIEYTGLRPGEKLYEELFLDEEKPDHSDLEGIFVGRSRHPSPEETKKNLEWLNVQIEANNDVRKCLQALLETYNPGLCENEKKEEIQCDKLITPISNEIIL